MVGLFPIGEVGGQNICWEGESIHADYSNLTDLRPPVKLTREERRRRRGRAGRRGWLPTTTVTAMPGTLQTILPAAC